MPLSLIEESLPVALLCKIHVYAERDALESRFLTGDQNTGSRSKQRALWGTGPSSL